MRIRSVGVGVALLLQGNGPPQDAWPIALTACVPTAPMPIARWQRDNSMPRYHPDIAGAAPMPTLVLVPCYFGDAIDIIHGRP